ncbi:hypothetical protein D1818_10980 [Aquimarina sp. BL5]|uniref:hypothetical protein n=1 Tax=Aquimarina sp. BL5 TaxID=1714860 RepID=UPI000E54E5D1|nr:hypothetical protein [Aquimarina sp. BL5]AXT51329.1 hypothetical protein D1818_10980 [Aquimarina sp. BL5]RKN09881.1 hypothetical protein D7036_03670 [Aquimarina sp. BL5]
MKVLNFLALLVLVLLLGSCELQSDSDITQGITVSEVKDIFNKKQHQRLENGVEFIEIKWDQAIYKIIDEKEVLIFPISGLDDEYISKSANKNKLYPISNNSYAIAYREEGNLQLKLIKVIPTESSKPFTGFIEVEDWSGKTNGSYEYKNGNLALNDSLSKSLDCTTTYYYACTEVSVGGEVVGDYCDLIRTATSCVSSDAPSIIFPDDPLGSEGGGSSSSSDDTEDPSCESFNFQTYPGSLYQEAAVKGVHFNIVVISQNGIQRATNISFPQPILFGIPTNYSIGGDFSAGAAAELSAEILEITMDEIVRLYGTGNYAPSFLRTQFRNLLISNYRSYTAGGGRVQFNYSGRIPATQYQTNWFTNGDCD